MLGVNNCNSFPNTWYVSSISPRYACNNVPQVPSIRSHDSFSGLQNVHDGRGKTSILSKCTRSLRYPAKWPVTNILLFLDSLMYGSDVPLLLFSNNSFICIKSTWREKRLCLWWSWHLKRGFYHSHHWDLPITITKFYKELNTKIITWIKYFSIWIFLIFFHSQSYTFSYPISCVNSSTLEICIYIYNIHRLYSPVSRPSTGYLLLFYMQQNKKNCF